MAAHNLSQGQLDTLRSLQQQGSYADAWRQLAEWGDTYADDAANVTGEPSDFYGEFMNEMVRQHWGNTAGESAYDQYFDSVASAHLNNYLLVLESTPDWPTSAQIERSYRSSVENVGLPATTAFDGVFTQSVGTITSGDYDWPQALGMDEARIVPSDVFDDIGFVEASEILAETVYDTIAEFVEKGWEWVRDVVEYATDAVLDFLDDARRTALEKLREFVDSVKDTIEDVYDSVRDFFDDAKKFIPRRDPLVLDLDGDGIETVAATGAVLFDHDGDGVRSGTGWIAPDDGLLVLDRNGNGLIDNGGELFGADTVLSDGSKAASGFAALADLDSNEDGIFDAEDVEFANVRVWRDLNQDGVSQAGELFTLDQLGIASINLTPTTTADLDLGNGNVVDNRGTFTRTDGTTGLAGDLLLAMNHFFSDFTGSLDPVTVTDEAGQLPGLKGSGAVRDLAEAASLSTNLLSAVQALEPGISRNAMRGELDTIASLWASTSTMQSSEEVLESSSTVTRTIYYHGAVPASVTAQGEAAVEAWKQQQHAELAPIIAILEQFNGSSLVSFQNDRVSTGGNTYVWKTITHADGSTEQVMSIVLQSEQISTLLEAYAELKESIYARLVLDTRLDAYMGSLNMQLVDGQLLFDLTAFNAMLSGKRQSNLGEAFQDLVDLYRYAGSFLGSAGWNGAQVLATWIADAKTTPDGLEALSFAGIDLATGSLTGTSENDVLWGDENGNTLRGGAGGDLLVGNAGNDTLAGDNGQDILLGGLGNDTLNGGAGDDRLIGGVGNDNLTGGDGSDIYIYELGDGQDTINNYDVSAGRFDVLELGEGITPDGVTATRLNNNLILSINGTTDRITVNNYFTADGAGGYQLDQIRFADGTIWTVDVLKPLVQIPTEGNDNLYGYAGSDTLTGLAGNDVIYGYGGDDVLEGGLGNDSLSGGTGSDTYLFNAGDGQDTIDNYDNSAGRFDVLQLGEGIAPADVTARRSGTNLVLSFAGSTDRITITNYFESDAAGYYRLDEIRFADGSAWNVATVKSLVQIPTEGNDNLYGYAGNDNLSGQAGDDAIYGYGGNDVLEGGVGNDFLSGGAGSDIYRFNAGDGQDTIDNYDNSSGRVDALELGEGIAPADVTARRLGNNLILTFAGSTDKITVTNYFESDAAGHYRLDEIRFANGTTWDVQTVRDLVQVPTEGDDALYGYETDDNLSGLGGADTLYGYGGDDRLIGGAGNDLLTGGAGSDVYVFNPGDGQDTINNYDTSANRVDAIEFGAGIAVGDVTIRRSGAHLVLTINGTDDRITVSNYFDQDAAGYYRLDEIRFADETVWNIETVKALVQVPTEGADTLYGYATNDNLTGAGGNDTLYGYGGNDVLGGGSGNDTLDGGAGSDTYLFDLGDGQDTINNYDTSNGRTDVLLFGQNVVPADVTVRRVNGNLVLAINGTDDRVTISNYFNGDAAGGYQLDEIRFAGAPGTFWDVNAVKALALAPTSGDDTLQGYASNDTIAGGNGNDTIYGNAGDDLLQGESGNDVLYGGAGHDTLVGGEGNDSLNGDAGDDVLQGGAGNDTLNGGAGSDTYLFNAGDGQDVISNYDTSAERVDVLQLGEGILPTDVTARRSNNDLVLTFVGSNDRVTVTNYFAGDAAGSYQLDQIRFADETVWDVATVKALVLVPTSGNDILQGYASDDVLAGGDGNDTIYGNAGDDVLQGESGSDVLYGGAGHDTLVGGEGNDSLNGDAGDDVLQGGAGNDTLNGGAGSDTYLFNAGDGQDVISNYDTSAERVDVLQLGEGILSTDVTARRSNNDLVLTFAGSDDRVTVSNYFVGDAAGNYQLDLIRFADETAWDVEAVKARVLLPTTGADTLQGYASDDTIAGGAGDDILYGNAGNDTLHGQDGNDTLYGGNGDDTLTGGAGADTLNGDAGDDVLDGGADNDILRGGAGNDHLTGGLGNDQLEGGEGDDHYHFAAGDGQDTINDTQGLSTIHLSGLPLGHVYLRRDGTALVLRFIGSSTDQIRLVNFFDASTQLALRGVVIDIGDGTPWSLDAAAVDAAALLGTSLDDVIDGNTLDNAIAGLAGDDTLRGGAGADTLDGGAGNDALYGQAGNDVLTGGEGNDLLDGGTGADQMAGGAGDDTYVVDDAGDVVTEGADAGLDIVQSSVTYVLPDNVEQLVLTGDADIDGAGNALDNTLTGNGGNNHLQGLSGDDVLFGNDGDDTLDGGIGDDQLYGGYGADVLIGGAGQDLLDGGAGVDQLAGSAGDDTYRVDESDDVIVELAGEGIDVVQSTAYGYALSANVEHLTLVQGSSAYEGIGNALDNVLTGNGNDNRLDGGTGADTLIGGLGNDTFVVDNVGDVVVENAGEGTDTVESSISYTLGATLENLTLLGMANLDATGNTGDNVIRGNAGNNRIEGGAGADTLYGGAGDDYYVAVSASDRVYEYAGEGIDTVERVFETNLVLENNAENLILGAGITTGNGNGLDNTITGNVGDNTLAGLDGNDTLHGLDGNDALFGGNGTDALYGGAGDDYLDGGAGIDHMEGGTGNDNYIVDHSDDVVIEATGAGTDQIQASASYALSANVENLFLTGSAAINGAGNDLDNYIAGNGAANTIHGGGGADTLVGGGGNDTLIGGTGDDKYVFDASSGSDVVDNADGGFDGIFFTNGITRERLSFSRDGDDLLIFVDASSTPSVRVLNHFLGGDAAIDYVQPDGGYYLTTTEINQIVAGGSTGEYDQVIEGTAAGEQLVGSSGKDLIKGLAGDDQLFGMGGNDTLQGGDGNDYLAGGNGTGSGSGDDQLEGGAGNDTLFGEDGSNTLVGGAGNDNYVYGGGQDTIDNTGGGTDGVFFNDGITASDLTFYRDGDDLVITVAGNANGFVRVTGHFLGGDLAIDFVQPASGASLNTAAINALAQTGYPGDGEPGDGDPGTGTPGTGGNEGNDADYLNVVTGTSAGEDLYGSSGRDLIRGLGGNDNLFGFSGDDKLDGGDGDDYLSGGSGTFSGSGNDILIGGAGNDTLVGEDGDDMLIGGAGDDFYYYASGSGADTVDNVGGGTDYLYFADVAANRLSYYQDGDDLIVAVDGDLSQSMRVLDHFLGGEHAIAYVQASTGYALPASQIPALLTPMPSGAMASSAGAQSLSVQRLSAADAIAQTAPSVATESSSASLVRHVVVPGVQAEAVGEPAASDTGSSDLSEVRPSGAGLLGKRLPLADLWEEVHAWDRRPGTWREPGYAPWEPQSSRVPGSIKAGRETTHAATPAHSAELDRLILVMAGFQGAEGNVAILPVHDRHHAPQLSVSAF